MLCKDNGQYDFDNARENWPTCLEDVQCPVPPEIPTSSEYVQKKVVKNINIVHKKENSQIKIDNITYK